MTFDRAFGYSFPLFSSLLKKEGIKRHAFQPGQHYVNYTTKKLNTNIELQVCQDFCILTRRDFFIPRPLGFFLSLPAGIFSFLARWDFFIPGFLKVVR